MATEDTELLVLDRLTGDIIGCAIEVHRVLGPALLEVIYEQALGIELRAHGIPFEQQVPVRVRYKDNVLKGQRLDLLVAGEVVIEIKSLQKLPSFAIAQVLSYLKATGLKRGLLLNFGKPKLTSGITRISL